MTTPMTPSQTLAAFKAEGLTVVEYPGWKSACRCCPDGVAHRPEGPFVRAWGDVNGQLAHITAGGLGNRTVKEYIRDIINGDKDTPLKSQTVIDPDGTVWVNSAGRCNHAGKVGGSAREHMREADFSLTDDFDNRFTGDSVDGNAFAYGDEVIAASRMNTAQYNTLVKVHAARARFHKWTGQESVGHGEVSNQRGKGDPNLDMGKFRRDVMARVKAGAGVTPKPKPDPKPTPKPKPPTTKVVRWHGAAFLNTEGDDTEGKKTFATRLPQMVADVTLNKPEVIGLCEVRKEQEPAGTKAMKAKGYKLAAYSHRLALYVDPDVEVGKTSFYQYAKQNEGAIEGMLRVRLKVNGSLVNYGLTHLDYRPGFDAGRVTQMKQGVRSLMRFGIVSWPTTWQSRTIILTDANSEDWVTDKAIVPAGFKIAARAVIDFIYVGKTRPVISNGTRKTKSDHPIVEAVFGKTIKK